MSAKCPLCHENMKDDFGLQECASCGAQLLVHMDGHVEYKGADEPEAALEEADRQTDSRVFREMSEFENLDQPPPPPQQNVDFVPPVHEDSSMLPEDEPALQEGPAFSLDFPEAEESAVEPTELSAKREMTSFDFDTPPDHEEQEATPPPAVYTSAASPSSPDLSDIAAFGNSEMSGGRDGSLRYNLIIEGIDTADVREAFREAITDRKFVWDIDQILRSVRNGRVQIHNVAPIKGYILVSRLRGLPVKIRWEQYAIQQT